jgi:hypothetical protein
MQPWQSNGGTGLQLVDILGALIRNRTAMMIDDDSSDQGLMRQPRVGRSNSISFEIHPKANRARDWHGAPSPLTSLTRMDDPWIRGA